MDVINCDLREGTKEDKLRAANALAKASRDSQQNSRNVAGSRRRSPGNAGKWG